MITGLIKGFLSKERNDFSTQCCMSLNSFILLQFGNL